MERKFINILHLEHIGEEIRYLKYIFLISYQMTNFYGRYSYVMSCFYKDKLIFVILSMSHGLCGNKSLNPYKNHTY